MMKQAYWLVSGIVVAIGVGTGVAMMNPQGTVPGQSSQTETPQKTPETTPPSAPISGQIPDTTQTDFSAETADAPSPLGEKVPDLQPQLTDQSKIAINGIGPIRVGMTVTEAAKSAGVTLVTDGVQASEGCFYYESQEGPQDLGFMVIDDRIVRVDVWPNSPITTLSGAGIGSTEADLQSLYPGQIEISPHQYVEGNYLTFVPQDSTDQAYRIVFETDSSGVVTTFRSGQADEVRWIEGCA